MQSWCGNKYCMISWSVTLSKGNNKWKKFHNSGQRLHTKICSMIVYQQWWICPWGSLETKEDLTTKRFRYLILRHQTRKISWTNIHWLQPSLRIQSFANRYRVMRSFLSPKLSIKLQDYDLFHKSMELLNSISLCLFSISLTP